jgi:hypothetical protein
MLKKAKFIKKEHPWKVQAGSKEGITTYLKPSSLKTHCTTTQVDPILAHSGSWCPNNFYHSVETQF